MVIRFSTVAGRKARSRFLDAIKQRLTEHYSVFDKMNGSEVELDVIIDSRNPSVYECYVSVLHRGNVFHDSFVFWKRYSENGTYTAMAAIVKG